MRSKSKTRFSFNENAVTETVLLSKLEWIQEATKNNLYSDNVCLKLKKSLRESLFSFLKQLLYQLIENLETKCHIIDLYQQSQS